MCSTVRIADYRIGSYQKTGICDKLDWKPKGFVGSGASDIFASKVSGVLLLIF